MTFKEAKKILKKEGFYVEKATRPCAISESFIEYEDPTICEAMQVVNSAGCFVCMEMSCFDERKARLKKEYEKNTKAPGPGEEQSKEGNPALKEAASQFNDALLDEQAKKIEDLTKEKTNLEDQITILNACKEHNKNVNRKRIKRLSKEIAKLNSIIHDKNAVLSDVAEELRLTKIREKNLTEVGQKYMKENEELKKELADKVVDKIDAQALKNAESALAWKEKVITYKDKALAYYEKKIAEKDEVIADLGNELAATKKELEENTKQLKMTHRQYKESRSYGIAAEKMIQKMAKAIVGKGIICPEDFEEYRLWANGYRFNPQLPDFSKEEEKKPSLFRDDSVGAVTNQKDCSPVKDTHPTEDNPDVVEMDEFLERVRKALEEGHTVSIDYDKAEEGGDKSATIVECGKDIDDVFEEIKRLCQE